MRKAPLLLLTILFIRLSGCAQIVTGAQQMDRYLPLLQRRSVAIFANPTSVLEAYSLSSDKEHFFLGTGRGFDRLDGGPVLRQQMRDGLSEAEMRKTWQPALEQFKTIRKKYLLYAD